MTTCFHHDLQRSINTTNQLPIDTILKSLFTDFIGFKIVKNERQDRKGSDIIVILRGGKRLRVDLKIRSSDPLRWGNDDLAIEIWSVVEKRIPGYYAKNTDYIIWIFEDSLRAVAVPYRSFRGRVAAKRQQMIQHLPIRRQATVDRYGNTFHSDHVFAPTWMFDGLIIENHPNARNSA